MRSRVEGTRLQDNFLDKKNKLVQISQTLGGTFTMDDDMPHLLFLDPGGAGRTVLLPAEAKGLWYIISNTADAAETLTVKEDSNTTQICTIGQNETSLLVCDGTTWRPVGPAEAGDFAVGSNATDRVTIKGIYKNPSVVAVAVPSITDPDIARVQVDVSAAFSMQPAVGDAVIAIPKEALPTACRLQGAWVYQTDGIEITFGSEGGNVTGANKNFDFLVIDLT